MVREGASFEREERETETREGGRGRIGSYRALFVLRGKQFRQAVDEFGAPRGRGPLAVEFLRRGAW